MTSKIRFEFVLLFFLVSYHAYSIRLILQHSLYGRNGPINPLVIITSVVLIPIFFSPPPCYSLQITSPVEWRDLNGKLLVLLYSMQGLMDWMLSTGNRNYEQCQTRPNKVALCEPLTHWLKNKQSAKLVAEYMQQYIQCYASSSSSKPAGATTLASSHDCQRCTDLGQDLKISDQTASDMTHT
jgi:hypothetical protein